MEREDIRLRYTIIHILDSTIGTPVLSNSLLDHGSELGDFLRSHIVRVMNSDEVKRCSFVEEESEMFRLISGMEPDSFVDASKEIAGFLYGIMNQNIDIPPADLAVVIYEMDKHPGLALLKLNYKSQYTHFTQYTESGNSNEIIKQNAILPGENQKLSEAALIDLEDYSIQLLEKKYEVNGAKSNYFSQLFLKCRGSMSPKAKLSVVTKAVEAVQKDFYDDSEQWEVHMEAKSVIKQELEEHGVLDIPAVVEKIFKEKPELKEAFQEKIEKYNLSEMQVELVDPATTRKFEKQCLTTDTGIEIKIPMEEYQNKESVEFITNADGSISVLIKNIGSITSR